MMGNRQPAAAVPRDLLCGHALLGIAFQRKASSREAFRPEGSRVRTYLVVRRFLVQRLPPLQGRGEALITSARTGRA